MLSPRIDYNLHAGFFMHAEETETMTEEDWADHCFQVRDNPQELKETLYAWADHVEEQGLGYEKGLRLLADYEQGPRAPWSMGRDGIRGEKGVVWCSRLGAAPSYLNKNTKPLLTGHHIELRFSWYETCLEAYRDACRVVMELEGVPRDR